MRNIRIASLFAALSLLLMAENVSRAQMSQAAAIEYARTQMQNGRSNKDVLKELEALGLSSSDLAKLQGKYGSELEDIDSTPVRSHRLNDEYLDPADTTANAGSLLKVKTPEDTTNIFGHNIFSSKRLSFEPNENMAVPQDYRLGPGDQLIIDIWGGNETTVKQVITPEGRILIPHVGPVQLSGLTIKEATQRIKKAVSSRYSGIAGDNPISDISVTLGKIRTIQVNVLGEVKAPGTYRLSSLTSLFNALYRAGGVTEIGTLRAVKVVREGETVATVDLYDYLFRGDRSGDIPLKEGDAVIVPAYLSLVTADGSLKRPMIYELKDDETAGKLIEYAGGFASGAYRNEVTVRRANGREHEVFTVSAEKFGSFVMADGDSLTVGGVIERTANMVTVNGAVYRPGVYEVGAEIATVKQLIAHAEGLREDVFLDRAVLYREKEDLSMSVIPIDLRGLMNGTAQDILLRRNDVLSISALTDIKDYGVFTILGAVRVPGDYAYASNTSVEDLIFMAGGLLDGASTVKIDISRRVNDPESTEPTSLLAESFTVDVRNGLVVGSDPFILEPYDIVSIRNNPVFNQQKVVEVEGEVSFEGSYILENTNERVSDIIRRAGGLSPRAYIPAAKLLRRMKQEEKDGIDASLKMIRRGGISDTLALADTLSESYYSVGVQFDKAVANPGSDYDIVLQDGDRIIIPEYVGTVRIQGEVMYPNTVVYIQGQSLRSYISQAGGFSSKAKRNRIYVVNPNGTVTKANSMTTVEPGSQIFVPAKPERKGVTVAEVVSLGSSTVSLATMILAIMRYL